MSVQPPITMTDEQIASGCKSSDAIAQKALYDKFSRKMFGVCLRYAKGREEAEDFLQEGMITVFQRISSFNQEGSLEGWVRRVVVNTCLEHLRKQKLQWVNIDEIEESAEDGFTMEKINVKDLLEVINALPTGFKAVFNLYAIEGFTHKEIAELLSISEGTSKSQYARAKAVLIKRIEEKTIITGTSVNE
ncbi:MAG: sigma-70 family RNA polymerase sigma factor [Cyclobacteriaceae bacterium]|nr:sigma-70 family RNA polymerase sigma factor [Cyclobacteriaceae bacterium]